MINQPKYWDGAKPGLTHPTDKDGLVGLLGKCGLM